MTKDILYSPWRLKYILSEKDKSCVFCLDPAQDPDHFVVFRSKLCFVILNLFPYNNGHLLVIPNRHIADFTLLTPDELHDIVDTTQLTTNVINNVYQPQGINIGMNLGAAAGAGIDDHLHLHIVPRWSGDTNFMTTVAGQRVVPEDFTISYQKLKNQFDTESSVL